MPRALAFQLLGGGRGPWGCWALLLLAVGCSASKGPARDAHRYAVWETLELDRCASAWLLKRFIDTEAEFTFYPDGTLDVAEIPFDMPTAEFRRSQNRCVFEQLMHQCDVRDTALAEIGALVHAIEIDYWVTTRDSPARELDERFRRMIEEKPTDEALEASFQLFDEVLLEIRSRASSREPHTPP